MPDTKDYRTPFKDYVADKMPFEVKDTGGNTPHVYPVAGQTPVSGTVTPKELPQGGMDLWYGPGMKKGSGGGN